MIRTVAFRGGCLTGLSRGNGAETPSPRSASFPARDGMLHPPFREAGPMTVTIRDETAAGRATGETVVEFLTETVTVRELIRGRVYQEVDDYNRRRHGGADGSFRGLVDPTDAERTLNGVRPRSGRAIDWRAQFDLACTAFDRNGFFVLVDEKQVESLDDEVTLRPGTAVSFVKLTPLVGG